jgi:Icc-related predicted phosphoesterase
MRAAIQTFGAAGVKHVFQVGDFSLAWPGRWPMLLDILEKECKAADLECWVTPGNHDNWNWINSRPYDEAGQFRMSDRTVLLRRNARFELGGRSFVSLGGAPSIDFPMRTQGIDWWDTETIRYEDVMRCREAGYADVMLCHDAPDGGTDEVQRIIDNPDPTMWTQSGLRYAAQGRVTMNHAIAGVKPRVFAHGHFHSAGMKQVDETLFVSLGCNNQANNLALLDLDTLQVEWLPINR